MSNNNQKQQTVTSTQIRNFYSDGISYLNVSFFNTNLSFKFYPFIRKDNIGKSEYDLKNGINTTVNFEGAYALWDASNNIIDVSINEINLPIPCAAGAILTLERKLGQNGEMETIFSISKNGILIPFKFQTTIYQTKENGQAVTKIIESGLGAFMKTIEGYLVGINADRHLDKLTEDFVKLQNSQNNNSQNATVNNQQQNTYNNYKKNYNNYKKPYNNQYSNTNNYNNNNPNIQQDYSTYRINN